MKPIPTLQTERLILRPPVHTDFHAYAELMASPRARYMGGPFDGRAAWGMFCNDVAQWQLFGHGCLMIERRATGACVGEVGINHGPLFPEKELGWFVYAGHEGQGYAFEAAVGLRDWAFEHLGLPIWSAISTRTIRARSRLPGAWAPCTTLTPGVRTPKIWCFGIGPAQALDKFCLLACQSRQTLPPASLAGHGKKV